MRRGRTRPRPTRPAKILVFAESRNDSTSIKELLVAANPSLAGIVQVVLNPTTLTRDAQRPAVDKWINELSAAVKAHVSIHGKVRAVVVHRDADGPDRQAGVAAELARQLAPLDGHAVVPVQMMEAWWFLFPEAVESVRPHTWRGLIPRQPRDVETIAQPKRELIRLTRPSNHEYAESDSVHIAAYVRERSLEPAGTSASYDRLRATAARL